MQEVKELKAFRGYGISKAWKIDLWGHKVKGSDIYLVDDGEDYIGEEYSTLEEAKRFIKTL